MSLRGTTWTRKSDAAEIRITADTGSGSGRRYVLAFNLATCRSFWVTPEGLGRKYTRTDEASTTEPEPETRREDTNI